MTLPTEPTESSEPKTESRGPCAADTVNALIAAYPTTVGIFNAFGIDACCGGAATLREAAARHGVELPALLGALRTSTAAAVPPPLEHD